MSEFVVYVDESGDHGPTSPDYLVFVLVFCVFRKVDYANAVVPSVSTLKFKYFGHDGVVFHERDIRKALGPFAILQNPERRLAFLEDIGSLIRSTPVAVISAVIRKDKLRHQYTDPTNPYHLGLLFGLERVEKHLREFGDLGLLHVLFESRGKREDADLELEFRRICDGSNAAGRRFQMEPVFVPEAARHAGLEIADLMGRPIGQHVLDPAKQNRAFDAVRTKIRSGPSGEVAGWGLKVFP